MSNFTFPQPIDTTNLGLEILENTGQSIWLSRFLAKKPHVIQTFGQPNGPGDVEKNKNPVSIRNTGLNFIN